MLNFKKQKSMKLLKLSKIMFDKISTLLLLFCLLLFNYQLEAQFIPNADFENWTTVSGQYQEPDLWISNNYYPNNVSVEKTTDSYSGNFALKIINNGYSFEGIGNGSVFTTYISNNILTAISIYLKCDSIVGTGEGKIYITGFSGGNIQQIGDFQFNSLIPQYNQILIPLNPVQYYDSIRVVILAWAQQTPTGQPTGSINLM